MNIVTRCAGKVVQDGLYVADVWIDLDLSVNRMASEPQCSVERVVSGRDRRPASCETMLEALPQLQVK